MGPDFGVEEERTGAAREVETASDGKQTPRFKPVLALRTGSP